MLELAKQILDETDGKICKNCLGRKLSKTIEGTNNIERADKVCSELNIDLDDVDCVICDNLFDKLDDELYKKIDDKINEMGIEFDTFLVGSKISKEIQERDEELSEKFDLNVETIKKEVNRLIDLNSDFRLAYQIYVEDNVLAFEFGFLIINFPNSKTD